MNSEAAQPIVAATVRGDLEVAGADLGTDDGPSSEHVCHCALEASTVRPSDWLGCGQCEAAQEYHKAEAG